MKLNQSVQKAAAILRAAAARPDGETASGLARMVGLSHATSLRLVHTLENEGLLMRRPEDGRYVIGLDLLRLGAAAEHAELLSVVSRKPLKRVAEETRETITLSVLRGREALDVVMQIDAPHVIQAVNWVGQRYPLHASSGGKIVLAALDPTRLGRILARPLERCASATITDPGELQRELERVRRQGYSVIVDELEDGLASVSVPILGADRRLLGTVNVTGPSFRFDVARRSAALEHARVAVAEIETRLGGD
jgi:DNA-binding IclR family transcriptional regulator